MNNFRKQLGDKWFLMTTYPWQSVEMANYDKQTHINTWILGWIWALNGIVAGTLFASPILDIFHIKDANFEHFVGIVMAVVVGFMVQLFGWIIFISFSMSPNNPVRPLVLSLFTVLVALVGFAIFRSIGTIGNIGLTVRFCVGLLLISYIVILFLTSFLVFVSSLLGFFFLRFGVRDIADSMYEKTSSDYLLIMYLPFLLSLFCIYWGFIHLDTNWELAGKGTGLSLILKVFLGFVFSALPKVLSLLGISAFFTGLTTTIRATHKDNKASNIK
jgi:hypothetical protein